MIKVMKIASGDDKNKQDGRLVVIKIMKITTW
jgi:hypothetical protein